MKYKLVIFDFDGTLADSFPWFLRNINEVAAQFGFKQVKESEIGTIRGMSSKKVLDYLEVPMWKLPMISNHLRKRMAKDVAQIPLFPGVDVLLRELSESQFSVAIVSSNSKENIQAMLGSELASLIQYYECGASMFGKRQKLRKIFKLSGISLHEAIFIGDESRDIEAAHGENIASGAVGWGYNTIESLKTHAPKEVFSTIDEMTRALVQKSK